MEPEWSDFKVLIALGDAGSVAGAARALGVDSSTVSRRLAALEEAVGATLIIRGGREFAVTADGRAMIEAARAMADASQRAVTAIRIAKQEIAGTVRVSCVSSFVAMLSELPHIARQRYPALDIAILASNRIVDLAHGEVDIAIRHIRPKEADLVLKQTIDIGWGVYVGKSYANRMGMPRSPGELKDHALVLYDQALLHIPGPRWLEAHANGAKSIVRVDSASVATQVIASGAGIGAVVCFQGDSNPELIRVFPAPVVYGESYVVYHESLRGSARVRAVVDLLAEFLKSKEPLLSARQSGNCS